MPLLHLLNEWERCGADALVAEGTEAGGHIGENTTMVLVPQVVDAVSIPVIAAGGIADGRGIAAAFMLGAQAVQMGLILWLRKNLLFMKIIKNALLRQGISIPGLQAVQPGIRAGPAKPDDEDLPTERTGGRLF